MLSNNLFSDTRHSLCLCFSPSVSSSTRSLSRSLRVSALLRWLRRTQAGVQYLDIGSSWLQAPKCIESDELRRLIAAGRPAVL